MFSLPVVATLFAPPVHAFTSGQNASLVIGQSSFTGVGPETVHPTGIVFDPSGNEWVADYSSNRVLRFPAPITNGESANLVIGQSDFVSSSYATSANRLYNPLALAFDPSGNLWVADGNNNRVLRYSPPFTTGMSANLELGQLDFVSNAYFVCQYCLAYPNALSFDSSGNLWVADQASSRVVRFAAPFTNGMNANLVIGQPTYV
ncbi:MAG: hypothetical protein LYZ66_06120 [Nitrososphaerales archaeon]|nr:hypothetical protein [Nitrososphaerales archaeon]